MRTDRILRRRCAFALALMLTAVVGACASEAVDEPCELACDAPCSTDVAVRIAGGEVLRDGWYVLTVRDDDVTRECSAAVSGGTFVEVGGDGCSLYAGDSVRFEALDIPVVIAELRRGLHDFGAVTIERSAMMVAPEGSCCKARCRQAPVVELLAKGCQEDVMCTLRACWDGFRYQLPDGPTLADGTYTATVEGVAFAPTSTGEATQACTFEIVDGDAMRLDGCFSGEFAPFVYRGFAPVAGTVTLNGPAGLIGAVDFNVTYDIDFPNGPCCEPLCHRMVGDPISVEAL